MINYTQTVQKCPVCEGRGELPSNFYLGEVTTSSSPVTCRSCSGKGYIILNNLIDEDENNIATTSSRAGCTDIVDENIESKINNGYSRSCYSCRYCNLSITSSSSTDYTKVKCCLTGNLCVPIIDYCRYWSPRSSDL